MKLKKITIFAAAIFVFSLSYANQPQLCGDGQWHLVSASTGSTNTAYSCLLNRLQNNKIEPVHCIVKWTPEYIGGGIAFDSFNIIDGAGSTPNGTYPLKVNSTIDFYINGKYDRILPNYPEAKITFQPMDTSNISSPYENGQNAKIKCNLIG